MHITLVGWPRSTTQPEIFILDQCSVFSICCIWVFILWLVLAILLLPCVSLKGSGIGEIIEALQAYAMQEKGANDQR